MIEKLLSNVKPIRTVKFNNLNIGGENSFHFLDKSKPLYVLELPVYEQNYNQNNQNNQHNQNEILDCVFEQIKTAQNSECDIFGLKFNIDNIENNNIKSAVEFLKKALPLIKKPLMIRGANNDTIDKCLLLKLMEVLDRECIVAIVNENTYKQIVPKAVKDNHILVIRTPIDINLAKEMNILTSDMGLSLDKILLDTDIGGLGYGLEYGYSIMEKIKLEGFNGDDYLNMPMISFAAEETSKTKEAKSDSFSKSWGDFKTRSTLFEIASASAVAAAGANVIVLNNPNIVKTMKGLV